MTPDLAAVVEAAIEGRLTPDQAAFLERAVTTDPAARTYYVECVGLHAALRAPTVAHAHAGIPPASRLSRRQALGLTVAGVGVVGTLSWLRPWAGRRADTAIVTKVVGRVLVGAEPTHLWAVLGPGDTIAVDGVDSVAKLVYPDGSEVELAGDTTATLDTGTGPRLTIHQGGVCADLPGPGPATLTLATQEVAAVTAAAARVWLTLGRFGRQTEVGVFRGRVQLNPTEGRSGVEVAGGEVGTLTPDGVHMGRRPALPDEFAWDLTRPLPDGWQAGRLVRTPDGPAVAAEFQPGTGNRQPRYRVTSDNGWTNGLVGVTPDSTIRVRYRVAEEGAVQTVVVVRPDPQAGPTAMVLLDTRVVRPGAWHTVEVRAGAMKTGDGPKVVRHLPPPWVGYILSVNTLDRDLGLEVAEFRVARPRPGG